MNIENCLGDDIVVEDCNCPKCKYIDTSLSRDYIIMRLQLGESKERAIRRGMEEHIENLMAELYHGTYIEDTDEAI